MAMSNEKNLLPTNTSGEINTNDESAEWESSKVPMEEPSTAIPMAKPISEDSLAEVSMSAEIPEENRITLSWKGITVTTKTKGFKKKIPPKEILQNVDGIVHPGSLVALMGASGAGKTTLLNILNFRNRNGLNISGQVMINGHPVDQRLMAQNSVFVQQEDIFVGGLKVREHLMFHANLRMKYSSRADRIKRVETILREMGLKKCENVLIGVPGRFKGISGGESKRLAFATEILTKPTLIYCDEPTSGLDSFMARSLVKLLKRYATIGRTIVCTIHQPSSETFELFDHICIMAEGKCSFIGLATDCLKAFEQVGFPCPSNYNPSDHYIFTLAVVPGLEEKCRERVAALTNAYESSEQYTSVQTDIKKLIEEPGSSAFKDKIVAPRCSAGMANLFMQFGMIFKRQFLSTVRDPNSFFIRIAVAFIMALIIGLTWFKVDFKKYSAIQNVPGALFYLITFVAFNATMLLIVVIPNDMPIVQRDYLSNVYKIPIYFFSVATFTTIEVFVSAFMIINVVYWMLFYDTAIKATTIYGSVLGTTLLVAMVAVSIGLLISSMASSFHQATALVTPIMTIFMLYAGFLIITSEIKPFFQIFQYISVWYYSIEMNMVFIFKDLKRPCTPNVTKQVNGLENLLTKQHSPNANDMNQVNQLLKAACLPDPNSKCNMYFSGKEILDHFSFKEDHVNRNIVAIIGLWIGFNLLAFIILNVKMYLKRKN